MGSSTSNGGSMNFSATGLYSKSFSETVSNQAQSLISSSGGLIRTENVTQTSFSSADSASVSFNGSNGILTLRGTTNADNALLERSSDQLNVTLNGVVDSFDFSDVTLIRFFGDAGNDTFNNRTSIDSYAWGDSGNDRLLGGSGRDYFYGGANVDFLRGGSGDDELRGQAASDKLIGDSGNDLLFGNGAHDWLYGRSGNDILRGGGGKDGLFGGLGMDTLTGGNMEDRFLFQTGDTIVDQRDEDARLIFSNDNQTWTDIEVEAIDKGLRFLHLRTGNTRLLKDSFPSGDLTIEKASSLGGAIGQNYLSYTNYSMFNPTTGEWEITSTDYTRLITFSDWDESSNYQNEIRVDTIVHEIGHNWDSGDEISSALGTSASLIWDGFLNESGWTENPADTSNYTLSTDGQWWYLSDSEFARSYGRTNPYEDWATIWETLLDSGSASGAIESKRDWVNQLFDALS